VRDSPLADRWQIVSRVAAWSTSHAMLVVVAALLLMVVSITTLTRMRVSTSLESMLGSESKAAQAMHRVTTLYRSGDALMVMVSDDSGHADAEAHPYAKARLDRVAHAIASKIVQCPESNSLVAWVRTMSEPSVEAFIREQMLPNATWYLDDHGKAELSSRLTRQSMNMQWARNEAMVAAPGPVGSALGDRILQDPLRLLELVPANLRTRAPAGVSTLSQSAPTSEQSLDQRAVLVRIGARSVTTDMDASARLVTLVRSAIAQVPLEGLRVEVAGAAAIATTASRTIRKDSIVSTCVSILCLYVLFVLFYRRWFAPVLIGAVAGTGMIVGFAAHAAFASSISPLAAAVAALLAGLGVDYGIHFLAHYDSRRAAGESPKDAAVRTTGHLAMPITTNCMTSIFGFASLWPSEIKMLSNFASMGALGLIGALLAVFILMPAVLVLVDKRVGSHVSESSRFGAIVVPVASRPRTWLFSTLAVLAVVLIAGASRGIVPRLEADLTMLHPQPNAALRSTCEVITRFASQGEVIPVEVRTEDARMLVQVAYDAAIRLQSPACAGVGVEAVLGLHQLLPDPRSQESTKAWLAVTDATRFAIDFDDTLAQSAFDSQAYAGYRKWLLEVLSSNSPPDIASVLKYPSLAERLFPSNELASGHAQDIKSTVLLVRLAAPLHDRERRDKTVRVLQDAIADVPGISIAGLSAVSTELEAATRKGLPRSIAISIILVLAWLCVVFRKPADVLLALVPLFCASAAVVACMAIGQIRLNPINCVAIPLLDGIAVDAGVFLVVISRESESDVPRLLRSLRPSLHAVLLAVATTATGFAAMMLTNTPAIQSLGLVASVGIVGSLVGAVGVLVPLLVLRARRLAREHRLGSQSISPAH